MMTADTPGKRAYLIRLACGDGFKSPEPMAAFAVRLTRQKRGGWDSAKVSRVENGERKMTLDDVETYVRVDPLKRSRGWLAFGEAEGEPLLNPATDRKLTAEEIERARAQVAAGRASKTTARKRGNSH
jgi:hypothetical protein